MTIITPPERPGRIAQIPISVPLSNRNSQSKMELVFLSSAFGVGSKFKFSSIKLFMVPSFIIIIVVATTWRLEFYLG
jgi:hypothetical protein